MPTEEQRQLRRIKDRERYKRSPRMRKAIAKANAAWLAKHPRQFVSDTRRGYWLKNRYNMTTEEYEKRLADQDGHCQLCPATQPKKGRRMCVDHNHRCCPGLRCCGQCNRGILCANCNRKVGFLEEILRQCTVTAPTDSWEYRAMGYLWSYR